jgi:hypothetical protein
MMDDAELERRWLAGQVVDLAGGPLDAETLRRFCVHRAAETDKRGVRIANAVLTGVLDLAGVEVPFPLRFDGCRFEAAPVLHGASLFELAILNCPALPGLFADGIRVRRDVDITNVRVELPPTEGNQMRAAIWLSESEIGGRLLLRATTIQPNGARAIHADRIHVGGTVRFARDFEAYGEVRMLGARLRGSLDLVGVKLVAPRIALDLSGTEIGESVFLIEGDASGRPPVIEGQLDLSGAKVDGHVLVRHATLTQAAPGAHHHYASLRRQGSAVAAARLTVAGRLTIEGATRITGGIDLASASLGGLHIDEECRLDAARSNALDLTNADVRGTVKLADGVAVAGSVRADGAHIRGDLELTGVHLTQPRGRSLISCSGIAVDGDVDLHRMRAEGGGITFWRATLNGGFDATAATLDNPDGPTLRVHRSTVKGSVRLVSGFSSTGYVMLSRSIVEGRLDLTGGSFVCPQPTDRNARGDALLAVAAAVGGGMALDWRTVSPSVDFTDASTTVLEDDPTRWPDRFLISGFTYQRFDQPAGGSTTGPWQWAPRVAWLRRQAAYDAGPFEQAARVFRQHGYTQAAEQILIAQRADARRLRRYWPRRVLDAVYGWSVGYGYRPGRVLWLLVLLLTLLSVTFSIPAARAAMRASDDRGVVYTVGDGCASGEVRCFQPVLYAVDTVVPLISLDQRSTWYPDPYVPGGTLLTWLLYMSTVVGWLLSSIFLLSFTRLARSP